MISALAISMPKNGRINGALWLLLYVIKLIGLEGYVAG